MQSLPINIPNWQELSPNEHKKLLRTEFLEQRAKIPNTDKEALDGEIIKTLTDMSCYKTSDTLLLYYPINDEIDILKLARRALDDKKRIAFPRCDKETKKMTFHTVTSLSELAEGAYNIPEPKATAPIVNNACAALCVVPALAVDKDGFRLGYGGGYYDRFLDSFDGITAVLVYDRFTFDELPADEYDMTVDIIITEKEVMSPDAF